MINHLTRNMEYRFWVEQQEHMLRVLIERSPTTIEVRYFLILLLIARKSYKKAHKECQRILRMYPHNSLARSLDKMFRSEESLDCSHDRSKEPNKRRVRHPWRCCGLRDPGTDPIEPFSFI